MAFALASPVMAQLTLTPAGVSQGLGLSTFATGFPTAFSGTLGPLGIAFTAGGGVLVSDRQGNVRLFATDADGQIASAAPVGQNYGDGDALGLAKVGANFYMAQGQAGKIVQINANGTFNQDIVTGLSLPPAGMAVNPTNGHLFVSTGGSNQIYDVDPVARTKTLFMTVSGPDGLSISDGNTLYVAAAGTGHILGYNIATKTQVFDSGFIPGGVDGTAAGSGPFSNLLFVNLNNGSVVEVNLTTAAQTVIANGGSRGDFVTVDPSNNTLLLTQSSSVVRLNGASFVPEPTSMVLLGLSAVLFTARRNRTRVCAAGEGKGER